MFSWFFNWGFFGSSENCKKINLKLLICLPRADHEYAWSPTHGEITTEQYQHALIFLWNNFWSYREQSSTKYEVLLATVVFNFLALETTQNLFCWWLVIMSTDSPSLWGGVVEQGKQKLVLPILQDYRMRLTISTPSRFVIIVLSTLPICSWTGEVCFRHEGNIQFSPSIFITLLP